MFVCFSPQDKDSGVESKGSEGAAGAEAADFNLDDFLKFDSIPDVLTVSIERVLSINYVQFCGLKRF